MKNIIIILALILLTSSYCGTIHAAFKKGYVVVQITEYGVIIKSKNEGNEISVKIAPHKFKVGDEVKYDDKKNILKLDTKSGY